MRPIIILFYIILMIGCKPRHPIAGGDVLQGDQTGYWKIIEYHLKERKAPLSDVPDKYYLEITGGRMTSDSSLILIYPKGTPYRNFIFYDQAVLKTSSIKGVTSGYDYDKFKEQDIIWYRMNEESGFLALIDTDVDTGIIKKIRLSGVINSPTYKPELDSLRFVYEPTAKFRSHQLQMRSTKVQHETIVHLNTYLI